MNECSTCHSQNEVGARFCLECGSPLSPICASCGRRCPPTAKFCPSCGHSLTGAKSIKRSPDVFTSPAAIFGERKLITILFADIVASTSLIEKLDADEAATRLQASITSMRDAVRRYGGTVNKIQGDGVMAMFGAPAPLEDHALCACLSALAMHDFNRSVGADRPQIRVGVHTGEVQVRAIENDLSLQFDAMGIAAHVAARIQQVASPNTTLISAATLDAARENIRVNLRGPTELRGLSSPIDIFELVSADLPTDGARSLRTTPFVGRERELMRLKQALHDQATVPGRVIEILGEPGAGKSRLIQEFMRESRAGDIRIVEARSYGYGPQAPFQFALGLMRTFFGIEPNEHKEKIAKRVADALTDFGLQSHAPLIINFLGAQERFDPKIPADISVRRSQFLGAVEQVAAAATRHDQRLVVVEDAHWIDEASKPFLIAVAQGLARTRSLLVVTRRARTTSFLAGSVPVEEISLSSLNQEAIEKVIDSALEGNSIARYFREQIIERAGGNPFFAEELVRALDHHAFATEVPQKSPSITSGVLRLPNSVRGVIAYRIDRLNSGQKQLLQAASVLGRNFSAEIATAVAQREVGEVKALVNELVEIDFLSYAGADAPFEFSFRHPLVQEVAYASLVTEQRRLMHCRAAGALKEQSENSLDENAGLIAYHWSEGADHAQAATFYMRSAQWLGARDPSQALKSWQQLRKTLSLVPREPPAMYMSMIACGQIVNLAWRERADALEPIYSEAMGFAETLRDSRAAALITMAYGRSLLTTGSADKYVTKVKEAQQLLQLSPNRSVEALLTAVLSHAVSFTGSIAEAEELNRRALETEAEIEGADRQLLGFNPKYWLWALRARLLVTSGRSEEAQRYLSLLLNNSNETVDTLHKAIALGIQIDSAAFNNNPTVASQTMLTLDDLLRENRTPYLSALRDHFRAVALLVMRRTNEARSILEDLLPSVRESRAGLEFEPYILANLGEVIATDSTPDAIARIEEGRWLARARSMRTAEAYAIGSRIRVGRQLGLPIPPDDIGDFDRLIQETGAAALRQRVTQLLSRVS